MPLEKIAAIKAKRLAIKRTKIKGELNATLLVYTEFILVPLKTFK